MTEASTQLAKKLAIFAVVMFCFGVFVMPPLYNVLCDLTGVNAKIDKAAELDTAVIDFERLVTVEFDTNVNGDLPWKFTAAEYKNEVHPGKPYEMIFTVENKSDRSLFGQAIPSVAPAKAFSFFKKTECFCFNKQLLRANESKQMVVRFIVDAELPKAVKTITLSYTFFKLPDSDNSDVDIKTAMSATSSNS